MLMSPFLATRYDFLVVAPGLKINFDAVKGLREGLDNPNGPVSSIYSVDSCEKTWKNIQNFKEGRAVSLPHPVVSVLASDLVTASISRREWLIPNPFAAADLYSAGWYHQVRRCSAEGTSGDHGCSDTERS